VKEILSTEVETSPDFKPEQNVIACYVECL